MKFLVTGGTGFIGRRLVERLLERQDAVVALVHRDPVGLPDNVQIVRGDLLDADAAAKVCQGCDGVFHLAAKISFRAADAAQLLRVNRDGTARILDAARKTGVRRVVAASSATTIGRSSDPQTPLDESSQPNEALLSKNAYLKSKWEMEAVCRQAARAGQEVVIVNPTTVYGAGDHRMNSGTLVRQVATSRWMPVPPGGSNVVDVDDVVEGMLAAFARGRPGERYILGGHNFTFLAICRKIADAVGRHPRFFVLPFWMRLPAVLAAYGISRVTKNQVLTPQNVSDTFAFKYFSSERAARELGWRAARSFEETIRHAWAFYRESGLIPSVLVSDRRA